MIHSKIDNLTVAKFEETILIFFSFYLPFPLKIPHPVLKDRILSSDITLLTVFCPSYLKLRIFTAMKRVSQHVKMGFNASQI